ncbi:hypothetical protein EAE32_10960 [Kocuria tytonicola]|uniref:Dehydrogenase n=1 Tax=Kocuria tytonicola TaxID=2055946 RepID=A0A3L9KY00_9MICC|nr:hypothetical protein [Kocuria tytonicola]RLY91726.1 hypothetical protein EAE32_10960 [Kocuria tytonicola]
MGFFGDYRATRRDERELGEGVWRRAHDRFKRGLDRYHQILESVRDPELRAAAVPVANELAELLPRVRGVCMDAHVRAPSQTQDIPHSPSGYLSDVHRQLSRAGNAMAQTAEALTMARFAASGVARAAAPDGPSGADDARAPERPESPSAGVDSIRRRGAVVEEYVAAAEHLMAAHDPSRA